MNRLTNNNFFSQVLKGILEMLNDSSFELTLH